MDNFIYPVQARWSDLDPNFHIRHSVYYDWGAQCRVGFLATVGLTWERMAELRIGPILFREECIFRKEVRPGDEPTVGMTLVKAKRDFSRFTIRHEIKKNPETVSAILTVDIAWMSAVTRKLAVLPQQDIDALAQTPLAPEFAWID